MGTPSLLTRFIIKDTFFFQECKVRTEQSASKSVLSNRSGFNTSISHIHFPLTDFTNQCTI